MSERSTAALIDLVVNGMFIPRQELADRLAELDRWKSEALIVLNGLHDSFNRVKPVGLLGQVQSQAMADEILRLRAILAILPPCPTCGSDTLIAVPDSDGDSTAIHCPDCVDGKMSIEWCVAIVLAVFSGVGGGSNIINHLRAVRPDPTEQQS